MKKERILNIGIFFVLLVGMFVFSSLPVVIFRIPYENFNMMQKTIYNFICDICFITVVFLIYRKKIISDFKKYFQNFRDNFEMSFKYYFAGVAVMVASNFIITFCFSNATAGNEEAIRSLIGDAPIYMLFSVSLYAPFIEEMIFRHCMKNCFITKEKSKIIKYLFAFVSGFIFAILHILGQATSAIDYIYIVPYMSLGFTFGLLYYEKDNIFASIIMHSFHNTITIILLFLSGGVI